MCCSPPVLQHSQSSFAPTTAKLTWASRQQGKTPGKGQVVAGGRGKSFGEGGVAARRPEQGFGQRGGAVLQVRQQPSAVEAGGTAVVEHVVPAQEPVVRRRQRPGGASSLAAGRLAPGSTSPSRRLCSINEAAEHLGVSVRFVRRLVAERRIRHVKVGRFVRFDLMDLEAFVVAGSVSQCSAERWFLVMGIRLLRVSAAGRGQRLLIHHRSQPSTGIRTRSHGTVHRRPCCRDVQS